jgi:hypothetical protein
MEPAWKSFEFGRRRVRWGRFPSAAHIGNARPHTYERLRVLAERRTRAEYEQRPAINQQSSARGRSVLSPAEEK